MRRRMMMEEFHLTVFADARLPAPQQKSMAKTLRSKRLREKIEIALTEVFAQFPSLENARVEITK